MFIKQESKQEPLKKVGLISKQQRYHVSIRKNKNKETTSFNRRLIVQQNKLWVQFDESVAVQWANKLKDEKLENEQLYKLIRDIFSQVSYSNEDQVFLMLKDYNIIEMLYKVAAQKVDDIKNQTIEDQSADSAVRFYKRILWILTFALNHNENQNQEQQKQRIAVECRKLFQIFNLYLETDNTTIYKIIVNVLTCICANTTLLDEFLQNELSVLLFRKPRKHQLTLEQVCFLCSQIFRSQTSQMTVQCAQTNKLLIQYLFQTQHAKGIQSLRIYETFLIYLGKVENKLSWIFTSHYNYLSSTLQYIIDNQEQQLPQQKNFRINLINVLESICTGVKQNRSKQECAEFLKTLLIPIFKKSTEWSQSTQEWQEQQLILHNCIYLLACNQDNIMTIFKQAKVMQMILETIPHSDLDVRRVSVLILQRVITQCEYQYDAPQVKTIFEALCGELAEAKQNDVLASILRSIITLLRAEAGYCTEGSDVEEEEDPEPNANKVAYLKQFDHKTVIKEKYQQQFCYLTFFQNSECFMLLEQIENDGDEEVRQLIELLQVKQFQLK